MNTQLLKKKRPGWMLNEAQGSMLFYVLMIGAGAAILFAVFSESKLAVMQQGLTSMTMKIHAQFAGQSTYAGLNNALAIKSGAIPKNLLKGSSISTPWGGAITLAPSSDGSSFTISLAGIGEEDCAKLATLQTDLWIGVSVNETVVNRGTGVASAAAACSGNANAITYNSR